MLWNNVLRIVSSWFYRILQSKGNTIIFYLYRRCYEHSPTTFVVGSLHIVLFYQV